MKYEHVGQLQFLILFSHPDLREAINLISIGIFNAILICTSHLLVEWTYFSLCV